jgi:shikimate dehydrogenase
MGEAGVPSRVLALSRGSAFVYAALPTEGAETQPSEAAAPGQLDWKLLKERYLADRITRRTAIYGLVGSPVAQSIGAAIHNAALHARGVDAVYIPFLVNEIKDFRKAAGSYPLAGFSVTIPHKQAVLRGADKVERRAQAAGAANTVRVRRGRWEATNTDVDGIIAPLRRVFRLGERKALAKGFRAVILGNGGAARAAVLALKELRCASIFVTGRNAAKVRRFTRELDVEAMALERLESERFDLLVQTTPVGMWPRAGECPLRPEQISPASAATVFDLIYNPPTTR